MPRTPVTTELAAGVLTVTLDRAEKRNALSAAVVDGLHAALEPVAVSFSAIVLASFWLSGWTWFGLVAVGLALSAATAEPPSHTPRVAAASGLMIRTFTFVPP